MTTELPQRASVIVVSYTTIRRAIGVSGLALPVMLLLGGWIAGVPIQDNMSSYYHTPLRDTFVGTLCAIGGFLFCYRGYDWIENWTANLGGASALGVALFPLEFGSDPLVQKSLVGYLHTFSGGVFFLTLAFYSLYHFPRDSRWENEPHLREQWFNKYNFLFWMEWIAVWSFAAAWLAKGRAIVADIAVDILAHASHLLRHEKLRASGAD